MATQKKYRWGIVGPGRIARLFADDLALVEDVELAAVASTDLRRAKAFANTYRIPKFYGSYEALFNDADIDVVYVATLHHTHAAVSIAAMAHGKHVLCEKPVAVYAEDAKRMVAAAEKNGVFFMEAFWSRFNPSVVKMKELIGAGEIGKVRYINAEFTFYKLDDDINNRSLNVKLAGGSLLDIGVYPVFLSYFVLGKPMEIMAGSKFFHTGAEIQTAMIFDYEEAQAVLYSGFANNTDMKAKICGEKGEVYLHPVWHETQGLTLVKDGVEKVYHLPTRGKGFTYEIEEVHRCLNDSARESALWSHNNAVELISIVDAVREKAGIVYPFED